MAYIFPASGDYTYLDDYTSILFISAVSIPMHQAMEWKGIWNFSLLIQIPCPQGGFLHQIPYSPNRENGQKPGVWPECGGGGGPWSFKLIGA